ncbi:TetR/AcrR family transcriptional regulator [Vallitalea okinawensis]|uniref:TetR/AcrR family transcriptional regulator n=1 Tax=Vallitalea okinawensis TaxID=2078660 RepID=UPI000CFE2873|nr:TetR/AcrR family transcriptional regulator [Vallitalea okinawensis]
MENMTRRERKKLMTHSKMLRSAKHLFREKGYEYTSIEDITERADVSKSTLFKHFPNKESLLIGLADEEVTDVLELLETLEDEDEITQIKSVLLRLIEDSIPYLRVTGRVLFTTLINKNNIQSPFKALRDAIQERICSAQEKGDLTTQYSAEQIGVSLMSCYYGVLFKWFEEGGEPGAKEEVDVALDILLSSLKK